MLPCPQQKHAPRAPAATRPTCVAKVQPGHGFVVFVQKHGEGARGASAAERRLRRLQGRFFSTLVDEVSPAYFEERSNRRILSVTEREPL